MYYTIATLKSYNDLLGGYELEFNKKGNKYVICFSVEGDNPVFVEFDNMIEASRKFADMSDLILRGLYSYEDKVKILKGEE